VFQIGERWMAQRVTWNTTRLWEVVLSPAHHIYLPVILKTTSLRNEYQITVPIQTESGYKKHRQWESCLAFSP
jgi:hypothetical protein